MRASLPLNAIDYHVVDNERSCVLGRKLFAGNPHKPTFSSSITDETFEVFNRT